MVCKYYDICGKNKISIGFTCENEPDAYNYCGTRKKNGFSSTPVNIEEGALRSKNPVREIRNGLISWLRGE